MVSYKNFTISKNKDILEKYPDFVLVLEDETGNDWYELQKNFKDDTLKILFDDENRIVSHSFDVSTLTPTNLSVAEVSLKKYRKIFLLIRMAIYLLTEKSNHWFCLMKKK